MPKRDVAALFAAAALVAFATLNPGFTAVDDQWRCLLAGEVVVGLCLILFDGVLAAQKQATSVGETLPPPAWRWCLPTLVVVYLAWLWLFRYRWMFPSLYADDGRYIAGSCDWETTRSNLFVPFNEHLVPLTRLWTYLLVRLAPENPAPLFAGTAALFFIPTIVMVFLVGRNVGTSDRAGLIAAALFSLTLADDEVVTWYSATQWLIPLNMLLGAWLLVARPGRAALAGSTLLCTASPFAFSIGMLTGPLTFLWAASRGHWRRGVAPLVAGLTASVVSLAVIRLHMKHTDYWSQGGRGMLETFDPVGGAWYSGRLFADRLIATNVGWRRLPLHQLEVALVVAATTIAALWTLRRRPSILRLHPAFALIVFGYAATMPFRTWEKYVVVCNWTRYQMLPQLGLALLVAGLLQRPARPSARVCDAPAVALFAVVWAWWQRTGF